MAWTDLSSAFTYNSQLTSAQQRALRDNITALANGDAGAPRIQQHALGHQPKNIINIYNKTAMVLKGKTGPFLFHKNIHDKSLHCRLFGSVDYINILSGSKNGVEMQIRAIFNDQTWASEPLVLPFIGKNAPASWHTLAALDMSEIPNDVMLEIELYENIINNPNSSFHFEANNIVFFTTPA